MCLVLYEMCMGMNTMGQSIYKSMFYQGKHLKRLCGKSGWVCILDANQSISKAFVEICATRRMNILIIGENCESIINFVRNRHPILYCEGLEIKYKNCYKNNFFTQIRKKLQEKDIRLYINYLENNTTQKSFTSLTKKNLKMSLKCNYIRNEFLKTIIQVTLQKRKKSYIIDIHSQINYHNLTFSTTNDIIIPYRGIQTGYEAFNYYTSLCVYEEYKNNPYLEFLIVKKPCISTQKNKFYSKQKYSVTPKEFARNCLRYVGVLQGVQTVHYMSDVGVILANLFPFYKTKFLKRVGEMYANA